MNCSNIASFALSLNMNQINETKYNLIENSCCSAVDIGLTCLSNTITGINWSGPNLNGSIPDISFPNVTSMSLSQNKLTGSIPSLSNFPKLVFLTLENNKLTGNTPKLYEGLEFISYAQNSIEGNLTSIPVSLLGYLAFLNKLEGSIPKLSTNLLTLNLGKNSLSGVMPDFQNTTLEFLHVDSNHFHGSIGALPNSLNDFVANNNCFQDQYRIFHLSCGMPFWTLMSLPVLFHNFQLRF